MSVREDREKSSCSGRGLGLAAAAIGVGVGAALYYFFNNRAENHPDTEGSTQSWQCNENFTLMDSSASDDSYITISEHSTSDTSIASSDSEDSSDAESENRMSTDSNSNEESDDSTETASSNDSSGNGTFSNHTDSNGSDLSMDWDITISSLDVPHEQRLLSLSPLHFFTRIVRGDIFSENGYAQNYGHQKNNLRTQAFRQRTNTLEECSICFELVLKDQEAMTLPCTHHFHTKCILPWLQEQQTCPNCRQAV